CAVIVAFSKLMLGAGGGADWPDCGSVASVKMPKAMALNGVGATMSPARALPEAQNCDGSRGVQSPGQGLRCPRARWTECGPHCRVIRARLGVAGPGTGREWRDHGDPADPLHQVGAPATRTLHKCSTGLRSWAPPRSTPNYRSGNRVGHRTRTQPGHIHPRDPPFGHRRNCRDQAPRPPARPRTGAAREAPTRSGYSRCASRRPFSIRADADAAGGNRFVPARFVLDAGVSDPRSRVVLVRSVLGEWKHDPALGMTDALSGLLNRLPPAPTTLAFGSMLKGRDFVAT